MKEILRLQQQQDSTQDTIKAILSELIESRKEQNVISQHINEINQDTSQFYDSSNGNLMLSQALPYGSSSYITQSPVMSHRSSNLSHLNPVTSSFVQSVQYQPQQFQNIQLQQPQHAGSVSSMQATILNPNRELDSFLMQNGNSHSILEFNDLIQLNHFMPSDAQATI